MIKPLLENTDSLTLLQGETLLHDVIRGHARADNKRVAINFFMVEKSNFLRWTIRPAVLPRH